MNRAKDTDYRRYDVYQSLCYEYEQAKDTVNIEKTLEEGMTLFPDSSYFLNSLINLYIYTGRNDQALQLLSTAISKNANSAQLYYAKGSVYETGLKDYAQPKKHTKKRLNWIPTVQPITSAWDVFITIKE